MKFIVACFMAIAMLGFTASADACGRTCHRGHRAACRCKVAAAPAGCDCCKKCNCCSKKVGVKCPCGCGCVDCKCGKACKGKDCCKACCKDAKCGKNVKGDCPDGVCPIKK